MHRTISRRGGFTIIEVLVAIVIIGLLSGVASVTYVGAQRTARDNARKTDLSALSSAIETYYAAKKQFPGAETGTGVNEPCRQESGGYTYYSYLKNGDAEVDCRYSPRPNWIPELGEYINPIPVEKRYAGSGDMLSNPDSRTYSYRHLNGGYMVYGRLEGETTNDNNFHKNGTSFSDEPNLASGTINFTSGGSNLYIIRK